MPRRFLSSHVSAALSSFAKEVAASHGSAAAPPVPVAPSKSTIDLPADHYLHRGAPTEWWWHIGTLRCGERIFGFEISATSYAGEGNFGFTQLMLTDVSNDRHFQRTTPYLALLFDRNTWAESDPTKDWSVQLGTPSNTLSAIEIIDGGSGYTSVPTVTISGGGGAFGVALAAAPDKSGKISFIALVSPGAGYTSLPTVTITGGGGTGATAKAVHSYVVMKAAWGDPAQNMAVQALLADEATNTVVTFDLTFSQQGPPFIVWGTGVQTVPGTTGGHLQTNNYYYSLTRLQASGTIAIDDERFDVTGVTWMDHEYGAFTQDGHPVKWIIQDMQLDNGVSISNFSVPDAETPAPKPNQRGPSHATVQRPDGTTYYVPSFITPTARTWTSPVTGYVYFMELLVEIPLFDAAITVTSLIDSQEFPSGPVYEGVASASGTFEGVAVVGRAWNEQALR